MHIEVSRHVAAPTDRVWEVISDVGNSAEVIRAIESVEMVSGPSPIDVGTTWRETRSMLGRQSTEEMTVYAVDPGRSHTVRAHSAGTEYESSVIVERAVDGGSTLTITLDARSTSTASRLLGATVGRALAGPMRRVLEQDLADLATAAELGPPDAGGGSGDESGGRPFGP